MLNTTVLAACAKLLGVEILEIGYGVGPKLIDREKLKVGAIPISGWVTPLDSRDKDITEDQKRFALNHKPWLLQVFMPLSGCIVVLAISILLLGSDEAIVAFASGFK